MKDGCFNLLFILELRCFFERFILWFFEIIGMFLYKLKGIELEFLFQELYSYRMFVRFLEREREIQICLYVLYYIFDFLLIVYFIINDKCVEIIGKV